MRLSDHLDSCYHSIGNTTSKSLNLSAKVLLKKKLGSLANENQQQKNKKLSRSEATNVAWGWGHALFCWFYNEGSLQCCKSDAMRYSIACAEIELETTGLPAVT